MPLVCGCRETVQEIATLYVACGTNVATSSPDGQVLFLQFPPAADQQRPGPICLKLRRIVQPTPCRVKHTLSCSLRVPQFASRQIRTLHICLPPFTALAWPPSSTSHYSPKATQRYWRGSSASRSPSPIRLKASTVIVIMIPGAIAM